MSSNPKTAGRSQFATLRLGKLGCVMAAAILLGGCDTQAALDGISSAFEAARAAVNQRLSGAPTKIKKRRKNRVHLVEVATVSLDTLHLTNVYSGSIRARRTVRIHAQEEGRVESAGYYEGDVVEKGTVVLTIDATLLRAQLDKAEAVRRESEAQLQRLSGLRKKRLVGEDEYLRASTAMQVARAEEAVLSARLGHTQAAAPFAGVVTEHHVDTGDIVARHQHVLTISDPASLVIDIAASEMLLPHLNVGDSVRVRVDALGTDDYLGEVVRIHPELDARTRQGRVEVRFKPMPPGARSGQFARVLFSVKALNRTIIPFGSLRRDRDGEYVFRLDESDNARRVSIRSGRRLADKAEVLEGVATGDRVVFRGFLGLVDGKKVKPVQSRSVTQ
ncbi:MAG: efflux RND transporter periplasmic adaptor subunit [Chromatiales bacterium]|jgi:RND family efflux transporter MFP subunit|nr:efflux RND transporter periplasmic adaptor subunit [Chromatiales bacterium]